ncbi:MAG TPA: UDP-N-acetylmuramoyl-L-alanine--D-glutamate ligase [Elusimicrobia bacterium]|nr:UDP-N-acetylmuramoyl-L-alanine--D-glutamate ligase [Elusimicrobiota bacterium]
MKKRSKRAPKKAPKKARRKASPRPKPSLPTDRFDPAAYRRQRACVLGLGRSGFYAALLLAKKGFRVLVSESKPRKALDFAGRLPKGVVLEAGGHGEKVLTCGFAVKSPGILPDSPVLKSLKDAGIPVFSELEVAMAFCPTPDVVAVTGTNGKTTVTHMAAALLKAAGRRVHMLGNVGTPVSAGISKVRKGDALVLEVSSYQLEDSRWFRPRAAAILNVTSDHVDHHGSMAAYLAAKARVYRDMLREGTCVFNASDPLAYGLSRDCGTRKLFFSLTPSTLAAAWREKGKMAFQLPGRKPVQVAPPKLPGDHNVENAMAAGLLALADGAPPKALAKAFKAFQGVEHRIEDCGKAKGLFCINDSKGTNVDSTLVALKSLEDQAGKILLILGGLAKPGGFAALRPLVSRCVKAVLTIGSAAAKIEEDLAGAAQVFPCETLEQAVSVAFQIGRPGETLLLSPACASMDQFRDYEHRGKVFKELLRKAR